MIADSIWWLLLLPLHFLAIVPFGIRMGYKYHTPKEELVQFLFPFLAIQISQIIFGVPLILKLGLQLKLSYWILSFPFWLIVAPIAFYLGFLLFKIPSIKAEIYGAISIILRLVLLLAAIAQMILIILRFERGTLPFWIVFLPTFIFCPLTIIYIIFLWFPF